MKTNKRVDGTRSRIRNGRLHGGAAISDNPSNQNSKRPFKSVAATKLPADRPIEVAIAVGLRLDPVLQWHTGVA